MHGNPLTLVGTEAKVGDSAPEFEVIDNNLNPVKRSAFKGKACCISSLPSLDTPVCDMQTRCFNQEVSGFCPDTEILTISMDLPFAQKQWCGVAGVDNVTTLSDHREASFGKAYGFLIKKLRQLARAVFIVDRDGFLQYQQLLHGVAQEPDYAAVIEALKRIG